jgi:hypothetical protein
MGVKVEGPCMAEGQGWRAHMEEARGWWAHVAEGCGWRAHMEEGGRQGWD